MRIINILLFFFLMIMSSLNIQAQPKVTRIEDLDSCMQAEKRHILVFLYTDWCKYCQKMKLTTLKDPKVVEMINNYFYFSTMNGETTEDIIFNGQVFKFKPNGYNSGIHELSLHFVGESNSVVFPSLYILDNEFNVQQSLFSFMKSDDFILWLTRYQRIE